MFGLELWFLSLVDHKASKLILKNPLNSQTKYVTFFLCAFQLVEPPKGFTFGTLKDSSMEDFFRKSQNPRLRKIYVNMKTHNVEHFADGAKKVLSG